MVGRFLDLTEVYLKNTFELALTNALGLKTEISKGVKLDDFWTALEMLKRVALRDVPAEQKTVRSPHLRSTSRLHLAFRRESLQRSRTVRCFNCAEVLGTQVRFGHTDFANTLTRRVVVPGIGG